MRPRSVVHKARGIIGRSFRRIKFKQPGELHFHAGDVAVENFFRQQLAFGSFAAWITNGTGRAAGNGNRMMAKQLKSSQRKQRHEIADVQTVRRRVEAAIERDGRGKFFGQFRRVRAIGNQAAPFQFFENAHARRLNRPRANANFPIAAELWTLDLAVWTLTFARCQKC